MLFKPTKMSFYGVYKFAFSNENLLFFEFFLRKKLEKLNIAYNE